MQLRPWHQHFRLRRARKQLRQLLKDARHMRNMREDVAPPAALAQLAEAVSAAQAAAGGGDPGRMDGAADKLAAGIRALAPPRPHAAWRENIEVVVVAVAVAMAFRTYFIQPFKIPTSSMHPTLHGIQYSAPPARLGLFDRWPLKFGKWLIFGDWHTAIRSTQSGPTRLHQDQQDGRYFILVNNAPHEIFQNMRLHISPGQTVYQGQLLASGIRTAGDHIFVNRLIWHFRQPRRGEIMVFKTTGIEHPQIKKNEHYVKRMVGLPNERLQIEPPKLLINGRDVDRPAMLRRIQAAADGYAGYIKTGDFLNQCQGTVNLGPEDYFACGDNQRNSLDSRYWGPVTRRNLVGPTFFVYWPLSRRWGWAH